MVAVDAPKNAILNTLSDLSASASLHVISPIEKLLMHLLESGQPLSLAALGGEEAILEDAVALASSPLFDELLAVLCQEWAQITKQADIEAFIVRGFYTNKPVSLANSLDVLFESRIVLHKIAPSLSSVLLIRIKNRQTELDALAAARALEGLLRLTLESLARKYALLEVLTSIDDKEYEVFAIHAAKIIIIAYEHWKEQELIEALEKIVKIPGARAEASFSLGLAILLQSFEQTSQKAIQTKLGVALTHFHESGYASEERDDAVAYAAAIEILLCFNEKNHTAATKRAFERLQKAIAVRQEWLYNVHLPQWLRHLIASEVEWARLAALLQEATANLAKPVWLVATEVLQQLFDVYRISRSVCLNINQPNLEILIQPRIEAEFLHSRSRLAFLEEWLRVNQSSSEWHETVDRLRARIKLLGEQGSSGSTSHPKGGRFPLLAATLEADPQAGINEQHLEKIEEALRSQELTRDLKISLVCEHIYRKVTAQLLACPHYVDEVKETFDDLLLRTINFLDIRTNLAAEHATSGQTYLFAWDVSKSPPREKEFQYDYRDYLSGQYGSRVRIEVSDFSSGRVDVVLFYARHRFVAEMKKELKDASPGNLKTYLGQTAIYQATDIRLGLLLVLDLTDKSSGIPHLEQNVWVETHEVRSSADKRFVVVFRVPGNRIYPSSTAT